jgi:hypothetical protein
MKKAVVGPPQAGAEEYYVCSMGDEHKGWMDGCMVWWCAEGHGYTYDLRLAGIFTDADKAKRYPDPAQSHYIPREMAEANAYSPLLAWWSAPRNEARPICELIPAAPLPPVAAEQKGNL